MARNYGGLSPYYTAVDNTLEQYVPLPFQEMMSASNAINQRAENIQNQTLAADSLIANIEALSPTHRDYVQTRGNNFREESSSLLDQYGGNAADPEFIRKSKQLIMKYANDGNFRIIASANQRLRANDQIAREMRAKGQLYINPRFTGTDAQGNLTDDVGEIELVNTLDQLRSEYEIAWKSMENNNKGTISNAANINRLNTRVMDSLKNQSPEFQRLAQAYMERGMTQDQATRQIQSDLAGLQGTFGIRTERDNSYFSHQLALRQDARQSAAHAMQMRALAQQLQPQGSTQPMKGSMIEGPISNVDMNRDKLDMVNAFKKRIDKSGNLTDARSLGENIVVSNTFVPTNSISVGKNPLGGNALRNNSAAETLKYMREELGWGARRGSAKQVAEAYEQYIKSDNLAPTMYVPSNPTVYNNIDKQFGNNLSGATYYIDGKQKHATKADDILQLEKTKSFMGISTGKTANGSPEGALKYRAYIDDKPVIVEVPLPSNLRSAVRENINLGKLVQSNIDNTGIKQEILNGNTSLVQRIGNDYYAPRRTSNGLKFAKINPQVNSQGRLTGFDFERGSNNNLNYLPDDLVQQKLHYEYNQLDNLLDYLYK